MASPLLRYSIGPESGFLVVRLHDRFPCAKTICAGLSEVLEQVAASTHLVLDMGDVHYLDAAGTDALLRWLTEARMKMAGLALCVRHASLLALLELVQAHRIIEIFDAPTDAAESILRRLHDAAPEQAFSANAS